METNQMDTVFRLGDYFFPHVKITADPDATGIEGTNKCNFGIKIEVKEPEIKDGWYQVSLIISSSPDAEKKKTPYSIELVAIGFFEVYPTWSDPLKLLEINGASILYAAAREFLITITSRGPWGPITLPMASFLAMYNKKMSTETSSKVSSNDTPNDKNSRPKKASRRKKE